MTTFQGGTFSGMQGDSTFLPTDISNLEAWYRADLGITEAGLGVSDWADQSGNGNDLVQATNGERPSFNSSDSDFNNQPSVECDGVDEFMATAAFSTELSQPNSIIVVAKFIAVGVTKLMFDGIVSDKRHSLIARNEAGTPWWIFSGSGTLTGSNSDTTARVFTCLYNSGTLLLYLNGGTADINSAGGGTDALSGFTLGSQFDNIFEGNFKFAEVVIYDKLLSGAENNQIGQYMADRYGFTWTDIT